MIKMNKNQKIINLGFKKVGLWALDTDNGNKFKPIISEEFQNKKHFLYVFIENEKILYVGKSEKTLNIRFNIGWANTRKTQRTSTDKSFAKAVSNGKIIEIWVWFPNIKLQNLKVEFYPKDDLNINHSALITSTKNGIIRLIEKKLIKKLNPEWNANI